MTDDSKRYFNGLLSKINGLYCIIVSDRDGVPLIKAVADKAPEISLKPALLSTFGQSSDQASKMGLGRNKAIICMYANYQIVQMNKQPLVVTFIGKEQCNTGLILALESQIDSHLEDFKQAVEI